MKCPRADESPLGSMSAYGKDAYWRAPPSSEHQACSYCGSMHPDELMALVEQGALITPTDESYKIYVEVPHLMAGRDIQVGTVTGPTHDYLGKPMFENITPEEKAAGYVHRQRIAKAPAFKTEKFYFQHLSDEQKARFVELINTKVVMFAHPGHFYVIPYFMRAEPKS
jgi:hypothetical protein